jgi:hypothetical protein
MDIELIAELYPEAVKMDGYDDCIIGMSQRFNSDPLIAYDVEKILNKLMKDGMSRDEAREFFEYNQIGAWVGENTPVFIETEL